MTTTPRGLAEAVDTVDAEPPVEPKDLVGESWGVFFDKTHRFFFFYPGICYLHTIA